ncbi:MAG: hypothetical protein JNL98_10610 [Bryobacterales bacterium]|nr:hypothetical protein [Bryobacterales bacterium]
MTRDIPLANLERLTSGLCGGELRHPSSESARLSAALFLSHGTASSTFSSICARNELLSQSELIRMGLRNPAPECAEELLGTERFVFFYVAPFRYPNTACGVLFASALEEEHRHEGVAAPFDTGGLIHVFTRPDPSESPRTFLTRHELPLPTHRAYLALSMDIAFQQAADYIEGRDPSLASPLGITGGDARRWTHEVRIPERVSLQTRHLQAVFAPRARVRASQPVKDLFQWCLANGVDTVMFDTPSGDEFETLRNECLGYIRRKLY